MPYQHDRRIAELLANGIQIGGVRGYAELITIDGQAAAAVPAIMKMRHWQKLCQIVPQISIDVPVAD
jgi:hypothetical protein